MQNKWLAVLLIIGLLLSWLEKYFIIIVIIVGSIILIRLLADLYWWLKGDKDD